MKYVITVCVLILLGVGVWYFFFSERGNTGPDNLPTAAEVERMEAIEASSAEISPNAVPGAGVRLEGSPPSEEQTPASTAGSSTDETETTQPDSDVQP